MPPTDGGAGSPGGWEEGAGPPAPRPREAITQEQLERVIRRASDLQFRRSTAVYENLDATEVERIGEEVGLERRYVRQAIAEVQAASLVPAAPEDGGFMLRWAGPSAVRVSRVVPGEPDRIERGLEHYLRERELLKPVRTQRGRSLWEPAGGLVSSMRRAMDFGGHGYTIAKARRLQVAIEPLESGWSLVTLTADMGNLRNETTGGWLFGMSLASIGPSVGLILATGGAALAVAGGVAIVGAGLGTARFAARKHLAKERERMELRLLGLLDRLERGETFEPEGEPWHQKLLRSAGIAETTGE